MISIFNPSEQLGLDIGRVVSVRVELADTTSPEVVDCRNILLSQKDNRIR